MVFGLESAKELKTVLKSSNYIREEFSKDFPFPLVLWVNDEVFKTLLRIAPDLESWATSVEFALTADQLSYELIYSLHQKATRAFATFWDSDAGKFMHELSIPLEDSSAIESALKDLQSRGVGLEPQVEANVHFVLGRETFANKQIEAALTHYQQSLVFWQQSNNLEWQGFLLFLVGLCHYRKAKQLQAESYRYKEEAKPYFQQCIDVFERVQKPELVNKFICQVTELLKYLGAWEELQTIAQKSLKLHHSLGSPLQLARDYGWLAEVALQQSKWQEANQLAKQALQTLAQANESQSQHQSLYHLLLAQAQRNLGQLAEAVHNLEIARQDSDHQNNPQLYIQILEELRALHFEQGQYLKAFRIKQEQGSIEQQYGFRAFIGANRLQPQRQLIKSVFTQIDNQDTVAQEIVASGRQQVVERLIKERISRDDHKLIVIHGLSGVGKSSILDAGLVPTLQQRAIGDRDALPVMLRVYTNWVEALGKCLADALQKTRYINLINSPNSVEAITEQLQKNANRNLLTILIFDQFEEFFFNIQDFLQRRQMLEFLRICLDTPFVKVILSLREDYLHYLLAWESMTKLDAIENNILMRKIRYPLGNLSLEEAHSVIQSLTERTHFYLESALIDELGRDLADGLGAVRPIELQVVGAQLQAEKITTLAQYKQSGPKPRLVERFLEKAIQDCGPENEKMAWRVLYLLTDEYNNRPLKNRADFAAKLAINFQQLDLILEILEKSGLIFLLPEFPVNRYQLVHDYLGEFIRKKISQIMKPISELELEELKKKNQLSQAEIDRLRAQLVSEAEIEIQQVRTELREKELRAKLEQATAIQRKVEEQLNQALTRSLREARLVGVVIFTITIIAAALGVRTAISETNAQLNALSASSEALVATNRPFDALLKSIRASRDLKRSLGATAETQTRVITALQQAVYGVREYNRLEGHKDWVSSVSWSPDGQILASASKDSTIKLWKADGTLLKNLPGHKAGVYSVSFSPNGKLIASASEDKTVKLWSSDGVLLKTLDQHTAPVSTVSFSPDGKIIASASWDKTVKLWNTDGILLKNLKRHTNRVVSVSFSPDGKLIASASEDKTVNLWSRDGNLIKTLQGHNGAVNWVSFSPDGKLIASANSDGTVKLWSRNNWNGDSNPLPPLKHNGAVNWVSFSPDGELIASAGEDKTLNLWSRDGNLIKTLEGHTDAILGGSFSPDGKLLASASKDRTLILWNFDLDALLVRGCNLVPDYLKTNLSVRDSDRHLCDDILTQK
jgi:WD40 repeat protein